MKLLCFVMGPHGVGKTKYISCIHSTYKDAAIAFDYIAGKYNTILNQAEEALLRKEYVLVGGLPADKLSCEYILNKFVSPEEKPYAVRILNLYSSKLNGNVDLYDALCTVLIHCPQTLLTVDTNSELYRPDIHFHALISAINAQVFSSRRG